MLRELKTFVMVARHGTFAAAGQQVGLTQSAVSAQMRVLEQGLGVRLFDRSGRAAVLNAAGRHALPLAEQMLTLYGQMARPATLAEWQGELKVGAIASVQTGLLPEALPAFRQAAPRVELKLVPGVSLKLLSQVDAGELDLALLIKPPFDLPKELLQVSLAREPFVLITPLTVAGEDPLQILAEQPFVRYDRSSFGGRQVSQFLREQRLQVHEALELDELDAIVRMVECGLGVSLIPRAGLWLQRSTQLRVIELGALTFHRELVALLRRAQQQPALECLLRCLKSIN
ncbi:DNA-binding transcriptional regulator, LysR family [Pseudomonas cuatrocienegasensis]|uniref:DNA-binding transcriptional regulator, LysR family n=1 Tax=Pseudomonas cuatrocienegasensis TaxID=543360 RepID=A0ABY1BHB6_9PSED|nr:MULTISPECIES: LysR substrate-binding domain-containing protein [Pseudomonas]OEC33312.1 LysR family transcriptional regulator [Pseudomonas sp. 21C1]SEQ87694.1 DNA-binding transcriptional regulator, LysR family [Pseudomonas cuatrocienegasensis]